MTAPHPVPHPTDSRDDERVEILLVDDRAENLLALEAILEPLGQTLVRAYSGEEALRQLLTRDFACILLDVQMPGLNGFETARLIKARERSSYIPIIFLTAISKEQEYVFEGYSVGAVDYLSKPFNPEILRSKVAVFVDLALKQRQLARQEQLLRDGERREMELKHMREIWESEARLADIVSTAMDAIVIFDGDGKITSYNGAAEEMFGTPAREAIGASISRFFPDGMGADLVESLCRAAEQARGGRAAGRHETARTAAFTACRASGESFPIEASISCTESRGARLYTLIMRDVSERHAAEEALRQQAIELQSLNEELNARQQELEMAMSARSRFYASMSHELRTPINAVLGYSTLLLENIYGPLNEKQAEGIQRTHKAAKHLLELVNDVLDLSKIEAGKIELRLQPVVFPALVEDLFVTVRPLADQYQSSLSLRYEGDGHAQTRVVSDPRRLRQILLNLLSNAIKFGQGRPIEVNCLRLDDGGVLVEVVDHGVGIAPDDQERIFQEFVQLGKTQLSEGTGLGLPISRRLAEMLHADLTVESRVGEGSTFRLRIPPTLDERITRAIEETGDTAAQGARETTATSGDARRVDAAPEAVPVQRGSGAARAVPAPPERSHVAP